MGSFSDIATAQTIKAFVAEIKRELDANRGKTDVQAALKKVGRFALTQFEWDTPDWAREYERLFEE